MKGKILLTILLVLSVLIIGLTASRSEVETKSSEKEKEPVKFEITEQALRDLQGEEIPEDILSKLKGLKNQKYTAEEEFLNVLEKTIGKDQTTQYKSQILKATYLYDPKGRREPFKQPFDPTPTIIPVTPTPDDEEHPLQKFELNQLQVIGIILMKSGDRARVLAPDGKSYTITVGTPIGKSEGKVVSISENCVTVKETKRYQKGEEIIVEEPETQLCLNPLEKEKTP